MLFADDFPWAVLFDDLKIVVVAAISLGTLYLQWRMRADLKANTKETVLSKNAAIGAANIGMDNREMLAEQKEALVPAAAKVNMKVIAQHAVDEVCSRCQNFKPKPPDCPKEEA